MEIREVAALLADRAQRARYAEAARAHAERTLDLWRNGARLFERLRAAPPPSTPGAGDYVVRRSTTKALNIGPVVGGGEGEPPVTAGGATAAVGT